MTNVHYERNGKKIYRRTPRIVLEPIGLVRNNSFQAQAYIEGEVLEAWSERERQDPGSDTRSDGSTLPCLPGPSDGTGEVIDEP